ncbi:hypothetical protein PPYR_08311 [Photinus pyralis]|uniref:Major facilitator superfamily (MFS) profile domain-containing protein n=2 Tax=Photinus pyralis TaxID=7054 RepID=A0A5N4AJ12_PHOPY|nr:facilitated trehalose transporter Tret1-like [Photinus pyralis]KAB0797317.1 hypothetical protein PPYR_08311 [Photinus pyralis]
MADFNRNSALPEPTPARNVLPQVIAVSVKNVLLFAGGMSTAYPTILIPALTNPQVDSNFQLNHEEVSWIGSTNLICALIGCSLSGVVTQPIGRKGFMQVVTVPLLVAWLIFKFADQMWHIYFALALYGLSSGLIEAPVLSYVAEVTQPRVRGMLSATGTLSSVCGVLVEFFLGTVLPWRNIALVSSAIPLVAFFLLCFIPESPHWLVMRHKLADAKRSLAWLRGWTAVENVREEFEQMCQNHNVTYSQTGSANVFTISEGPSRTLRTVNLKPYAQKSFIWPFGLVAFICFLCGFTGFLTLQTYAVSIFTSLNVPINEYYATLGLGIAQFFGSLVSIILVKCYGKRIMTFVSLGCIGICNVGIGVYGYQTRVKNLSLISEDIASDNFNVTDHQWVPLIFLVSLSFFSHCGIRVLPWILLGEIYSHETRAVGCGLTSACFYAFGFLGNKIFLNMIDLLTLPGVYWFYGLISFLGWLILYFALPETEGKSLQEIINHFSGISKLDNKIRRSLEGRSV